MIIDSGIQPNCSECALVVLSDELNEKQKKFFDKYINDGKWKTITTKLGNIAIEDEKDELWRIRDEIESISKFSRLFIYEDKQYRLIRDESYDEMLEEGRI